MTETTQIIRDMSRLGFRYRQHAWNETKEDSVLLVAFDVPEADNRNEPQEPPCYFFYAHNTPEDINRAVKLAARKSIKFLEKSLLLLWLKRAVLEWAYRRFYGFRGVRLWAALCKARMETENRERLNLWNLDRAPMWCDANMKEAYQN